MQKTIKKVFRHPVLQHGVFWLFSFYVLLNIFSLSSSFQKIDFIYTAIFTASLMIPVMVNLYLLIPLLLKQGKWFFYGIAFVGALFLFSWFNQLIFNDLVDIFLPGYFFISYYSFWDVLKFFGVFLLLTTLLQLSKEWFELSRTREKMILLEREKIEAELKALSNQVNPHFLFNSLNVLYSLAVNKRDEAPEAILKLSDILRYVIYESTGEKTSLSSEVQVIKNYMDLQRFRSGENASIRFDVEGEYEELTIAPMLLLPLVENGFKHGIKGDVGPTFLAIRLQADREHLQFTVENNKGVHPEGIRNGHAGVGLNNIRSRLQLLYPGTHKLVIDDLPDRFHVSLFLEL